MLVRGRSALRGEVVDSFEVPGSPRYLSKSVNGTSVGLAVSVAKEPVVRLLSSGGPVIGTFLDEPYEHETIEMRSGDLLAIYTDGVTEALNLAGVEFGEKRLRSICLNPWFVRVLGLKDHVAGIRMARSSSTA